MVRVAPVAVLVLAAGGVASALGERRRFDGIGVFLAAAVVALLLALFFRTRVELDADGIRVVRPWTSRFLRRDEIAGVSWEHGSAVVLRLRTGAQVSLPSVAGRDTELSGAIHAWLQRTETDSPQ
jgi:hypothetical protein